MFSFLGDQPPPSSRPRHLVTNDHPRSRLGLRVGAFTAITALFVGAGAVAAVAAPGDISNAEGQYLSGSLIDLNLALVAALAGETATSDGTADQTNASNLNLSALGAVTFTSAGGTQIPLDLTNAGVVSQYASALANASSVGASGSVSDTGLIGTGVTPAPGVAPGPLTLSLSGVVDSLGLPAASLAEVADLNLTLGAISGRASQAAPDPAVGSYEIADADISFTSPALAALVGDINANVAALQGTVDGLSVSLDANLGAALGGLGAVTTNLAVSAPDLAAAIAGLTTGPLSDPAFPGVTIDLTTGVVNVDLDEITALNGLPPNTEILTPAVINAITANILGLVTSVTNVVEAVLLATVNEITVVGDATLAGPVLGDVPILTIDTTVGALLAGDTTGVTLLNAGIALPGGAAALVASLGAPLSLLTDAVNGLSDTVLAPTVNTLLPAVNSVLTQAVSLTVNNQSTDAGVFTETALRVTVLPGADALELNIGTGRVGVNALNVAPVAAALVPDNGPETGGTPVTITGSGFFGTTEVTIDGVSVPFTVVDDANITFTTPVHAPGVVPVVVTDPAGSTVPLDFTFTTVTVVTSVTPNSGPAAGGTSVTITGSCFTGATAVLIGGTPATNVVVVNDTTITADVPAGVGVADVTVVGGGTCGTGTLPGGFAFLPAAVISALTPDNGPESGGTTVVITGTGFTGATDVTFDGESAATVTVDSDTQITVVTPAHGPGPSDVVVVSPNGNSAPGVFIFTPLIQIDTIAPPTGPETGGNTVTLTGLCFTGATAVLFGGVAATSFVVVSDTVITAVVPAGTGVVDVTVEGTAACGTGVLANGYEYLPPAAVTSLAPDNGPEAGGTTVVVTGTGFTGATAVTFDGLFGTGFTVDSDTQITVVTPAHAPGLVDVVVLSPNGNSPALDFTFNPSAVTTSLTPDNGPETGGTPVTIVGTGLTDTTTVTIDGVSVPFVVVSDTAITFTTPAHAPGAVPVVVSGPGGASVPLVFTFTEVVTVDTVAPGVGSVAGGATVILTGSCFTGATDVLFGGVSATSFTVDSDTQITAVTPAGVGIVDVTIVGGGTCGTGVLPDGFEFVPGAFALSVSPDRGGDEGGDTITITGFGFTTATSVTFGTAPARSFVVVSDTEIRAINPAVDSSVVPVVVSGPGSVTPLGLATATFTGGGGLTLGSASMALAAVLPMAIPPAPLFTYEDPISTSISPSSGPTLGGNQVSIFGVGFDSTTLVSVDGVSVAFVQVSDTLITYTAPSHAAGPVVVIVDGQSEPDQIGYTYNQVGSIPAQAGANPPPFGSSGDTPFSDPFLASTGVNWMPITLFGVLALLLGGALVLLRKRGLLHRP